MAIERDKVLLRVRADDHGGKRIVAMQGTEFIARPLQHVLPPASSIRHYGLLAPATKTQRLAAARHLLDMPAPNPRAIEDAQAFMRRVAEIEIARCPYCTVGRWQLIQTVLVDRAAPAAMSPTACRGPP